jgi:hypothetical protein
MMQLLIGLFWKFTDTLAKPAVEESASVVAERG